MKKLYSVSNFFRTRIFFLSVVLLVSLKMLGAALPGQDMEDGWTPTSCGLVLNFEEGDQFMLSVMMDKNNDGVLEEYFVCDFAKYTKGPFNYKATNTLKLIPAPSATEAPVGSVWTVGQPLTRTYPLDGIIYTMWSENDPDDPTNNSQTICTTGNDYTYTGALATYDGQYDPTKPKTPDYLCDVVFAVPTIRSLDADPSHTLGHTEGAFDGQTGVGFNGMVYREVYWFYKGRSNGPKTYTNTGLICFQSNGVPQQASGKSNAYNKQRTLYRIYPINKPFTTCLGSYFFAWDVQNYVKYANGRDNPTTDYTDERKIYTSDHWVGMERVGDTDYFQTDYTTIPPSDSTYFYVGYNNRYRNSTSDFKLGTGDAVSQFTSIRQLRVKAFADVPAPSDPKADTLFTPRAGACGRVVVDETSSSNNLGALFEPAGYFLRTSLGANVRMHQTAPNEWTTEESWLITEDDLRFSIKATLQTGPEFSATDPGADIRGWSQMVVGTEVPIHGGGSIPSGAVGWARIYTNNSAPNGGMEFVLADHSKYIRYHNNGHFGEDIPDQYAEVGNATLTVKEPRLISGYRFTKWTTNPDGTGTAYLPGASVTLGSGSIPNVLDLYAQADYEGIINVAISFVRDGKRYFLTHPGSETPRFAKARYFDDWTHVWQGMGDAYNSDPNYLSSYTIIGHEGVCKECKPGEYVLDPSRHVMRGSQDSLIFFENFQPADAEYIGLYYTTPYTVLANDTWAGLFRSRKGWPTPAHPCVDSTMISSSHYLDSIDGVIERIPRGGTAADSVIHYNASGNKFDGGVLNDSTIFMISGIGVVDGHYVVLPDTTSEWVDEIVFDYHENKTTQQQIWSKLIGKQLLAQMTIGNEIVYLHPNRNKILTTANELRLAQEFRLTQTFTYIPDNRHGSLDTLSEAFRPSIRDAANEFCQILTSGISSPKEIKDGAGNYIDICDTIRIRLTPRGTSQIKDYYGRWKTGSPGLTVDADGSRYRDIIVRTKTYHYEGRDSTLVLTPYRETYNFGPLEGQSELLKFKLYKEVYHFLHDLEHNVLAREVISKPDITAGTLHLESATCTFSIGEDFNVIRNNVDSIRIATIDDNAEVENYDTLIVSLPAITYESKTYPAFATRVPLLQTTLVGMDLYWSVVGNDGVRYFITAGSGGLIYQDYNLYQSTLYKKGTTNQQLIIGPKDAANTDDQYITPWTYTYVVGTPNQLKLKVDSLVHKHFAISGSTPTVGNAPSALTYEFVKTNTNDNANYEEQVRLKYADVGWLKFRVAKNGTKSLSLDASKDSASVFTWSYLRTEYSLLNNGTYPSVKSMEFNSSRVSKSVQTRYKAERIYSMLLDSTITYLCRKEQNNVDSLTSTAVAPNEREWKTNYTVTLKHDQRTFDGVVSSGLSAATTRSSLTTKVTPDATVPMDVKIDGKYVNIVDTLICNLSLQANAPKYRFKDKWSSFKSVNDACLKIPLICKTYHQENFDSLVCLVDDDKYNYTFPASITPGVNDSTVFTLHTERRQGNKVMDVDEHIISSTTSTVTDVTAAMNLSDIALAEIRMIDDYGNTPTWCHVTRKGRNTITVKCTANGIRAPRTAYLYLAYIVMVTVNDKEEMRFVNFRLSVSQPSFFTYANNQTLVHSKGASGDPLREDGMQQVHENTRVLYYYNPEPYDVEDQSVELPIRERGFYGWWRWYDETKAIDGSDSINEADIPDAKWLTMPRNVGNYDYPFRIIGDSVYTVVDGDTTERKLVTMGRYTVFHYPANKYAKADPPSKSPMAFPPARKARVTYMVDISNYYDNLPLSTKQQTKNQIDTAKLDTMHQIIEPTLSLREIFELRPWTEMAATMEGYKSANAATYNYEDERYMEDHKVMAPIGNRLLLRTEQRYNYDNLKNHGHSESLLGYYMRDDNYGTWTGDKDTMIWCGGWDVDCEWYTYNPSTKEYIACTHKITSEEDFLDVPARAGISAGNEFDTVYYCLRARSVATTVTTETIDEEEVEVEHVNKEGAYWFNICRYMVIYHDPNQYGPLQESSVGGVNKAIMTNEEITQTYEVLERLNFDYNKPGSDYTVYPHPLPWADASYGYSYPMSPEIPDNRHHNNFAPNFPGTGEYGLINRIPYTDYWIKMEQHGGAENGYMIYCDGMSSAGQVAALSLSTELCEGQKMYFSAYVGNPADPVKQKNKSNPSFTFSVQGSTNGTVWEDITSYMTGDIKPSSSWYQIFFPIRYERSDFRHFRVRIYNVASSFDGNDFVIDDMCLFATKPPLIAYQANSQCIEEGESETLTHVVLRVDYHDIKNNVEATNLYYTVQKGDGSIIDMEDGYINRQKPDVPVSGEAAIYGYIPRPASTYVPYDEDSIFTNLNDLITRFETTYAAVKASTPGAVLFNKGYIYESIDGENRPVLYVIHKAEMTPASTYTVRMALAYNQLLSSICAMTSNMKVSNRMVLELNGEEKANGENTDLCANTTYEISLRVKGTQFVPGAAPLEVSGSCMNDWLVYGDHTKATNVGKYTYSDVVKVVKEILRYAPHAGETNPNQFAPNLAAVSREVMTRIKGEQNVELTTSDEPYDVLTYLVNNEYLTLYQSKLTVSVMAGDSVQYVILPILGSGSEEVQKANVEICPEPIFVKLKPKASQAAPLIIGGTMHDTRNAFHPVVIVADSIAASSGLNVPVDSIMPSRRINSISLISTDDPNFREGIHSLNMTPSTITPTKRSILTLTPHGDNNYRMRSGYSYTYGIVMETLTGLLEDENCPVGTIPFTISVVPYYLRWDPQSDDDNRWNNPANWIGITQQNVPIQENARFAPLPGTLVIIPTMTDGKPYPVLSAIPSTTEDSVKQLGFKYNQCSAIRFTSGTALGNQDLLTYDSAIVDMSLPYGKWAFRAAPVKGMLSGDIYMADADLNWETSPWEVGVFDADGRNYKTGNASFWLSLYSRSITQKGNKDQVADTVRDAGAEWTRAVNSMMESLPPSQGWAIYTRTASKKNATVRLPKKDDRFYYFTADGDRVDELYDSGIRATRTAAAGGSGAGRMAYEPKAGAAAFTLTNTVESQYFVFGNPTMAYIDIWGFVTDNSLEGEISYMGADGKYTTVSRETALTTENVITEPERYLPPTHSMVVKLASAKTSQSVTLNATRVVTAPVTQSLSAPSRNASGRSRGIMTVTAVNPADAICTSRLLIGQGYHNDIREGEDAVLTTINIDRFSSSTPATPFNIYASEADYGLSIDLLDEVVNVPVSFHISALPFEPETYLWFTGVNNIDGQLVLYDALLDQERPIIDGIRLDIETPESSHETRYFIRRPGWSPDDPVTTDESTVTPYQYEDKAGKIIRDGHVFILRNGHVFTMTGLKMR